MACSWSLGKGSGVASHVWHAFHGVIGVLFGSELIAHGRASSILWCWVD